MGGGEGSAAREVLKHKTVESVVMCDIDEVSIRYALLLNAHASCVFPIMFCVSDETGRRWWISAEST